MTPQPDSSGIVEVCRWPLGDPAKEDFRFCGRQTRQIADGGSRVYCDKHHEIAHTKPRPKRDRSGTLEGFLDYISSKRLVA